MRKLEIRSSFLCLSPLLILPHPILCSTFAVAFGCIAWEAKDPHHKAGKQGRQKRKTSAANLRKKHYYMPCKKRFFRLSSSYLYFFHILTIMCCQNKIFPRLRPFSVEHTGGVSSCSTGKRRLHGKAERGTGRKAAMICAKKPPETNECAIFPGVRFRRFFSSCTTSITPREGHRKPPGPAVVRNIAKSGKRAFQGFFRPKNRKHRTSLR